MKLLLMTGNHPRHKYLANLLVKNNFLHAWIIEEREIFVPEPPVDLPENIKKYFSQHFEKREEAEHEIFGHQEVNIENQLIIQPEELNTEKVFSFIREQKPDVVITTGISVLKKNIFPHLPAEIWNIHGGLSPWYKGAITHFWPSYNLRPQHTGVTIHYITEKIDAGGIIHQTPAVLEKGDGLHQLSCRSLKAGYDAIIPLLLKYQQEGRIASISQKTTGKLWLKKDWTPFHLDMIYGYYNDKIVDLYLDGKLPQDKPDLIENDKL